MSPEAPSGRPGLPAGGMSSAQLSSQRLPRRGDCGTVRAHAPGDPVPVLGRYRPVSPPLPLASTCPRQGVRPPAAPAGLRDSGPEPGARPRRAALYRRWLAPHSAAGGRHPRNPRYSPLRPGARGPQPSPPPSSRERTCPRLARRPPGKRCPCLLAQPVDRGKVVPRRCHPARPLRALPAHAAHRARSAGILLPRLGSRGRAVPGGCRRNPPASSTQPAHPGGRARHPRDGHLPRVPARARQPPRPPRPAPRHRLRRTLDLVPAWCGSADGAAPGCACTLKAPTSGCARPAPTRHGTSR